MTLSAITALSPPHPQATAPQADRMGAAAEAFEAAFLAEMLRHAGVGKVPESFGGGFGEEAFSDFLAREYAEEIARSSPTGIGAQLAAAKFAGEGR